MTMTTTTNLAAAAIRKKTDFSTGGGVGGGGAFNARRRRRKTTTTTTTALFSRGNCLLRGRRGTVGFSFSPLDDEFNDGSREKREFADLLRLNPSTKNASFSRSSCSSSSSSSSFPVVFSTAAVEREGGGGGGGEDEKKKKNYRFTILSLVALALLLCNADRVIMSIVGLPMSKINGWDVKVLGLIQSSFLFGYALTPIFGGVLADKIGGARVLLGGLLVWSLATMVTPLAASTKSIPLLCFCRVVMGLGEGVALPCMNNVASRWVPKFERSRAVSFCMGGFQSGSMIGLLVAPLLMSRFGIAGPFYVFGAIGVAWAAVWNSCATSYPRANERVGEEELKFIEDGGAIVDISSNSNNRSSGGVKDEREVAAKVEKKATPWKMLLSHPATWACVVANFVNNFGFFILLAWMPKYFNDVVKLNLATSSWFSALPWATMAVSGVFAGILADRMLSEWKISTATTRKFIQSVGFLGPALCLLVLGMKGFAITPGFALSTLTFAVGCTAFSQSGFLVNFAEIGPKYASTIHGVANTAGSIAGMVGTYVVGWILSRSVESGWSNVMYMTSAVYVVGALVWLAFMSGEQVFE
jgi:ACS family sodium-dependent inorganic phosphate cotransporter